MDVRNPHIEALIDHLELYLGEIDFLWDHDANGAELPFGIARYQRGPGVYDTAFTTLGLSQFGFARPVPLTRPPHRAAPRPRAGMVHQELLILAPNSLRESGLVPGLLHQAVTMLLSTGRPAGRGDVIGPRRPLLSGSVLEDLYVGTPTYFPPEFGRFQVNGRAVSMAWLIPVSAREGYYATTNGWRALERAFAEQDPELINFSRRTLVL